MKELRILTTDEEMKVFSDPFRLQIISTYKNVGRPLTAKGVADILGVVPSKVHYHVKKLLAVDILVLDHIESINGIQAKFYKLTAEEFTLELSNRIGNKDLIASRTLQIFNAVIDEHKVTLHHTAKMMAKENFEPSGKGTFLTGHSLYIGDDEVEAFKSELTELLSRYKEKKNDDQILYQAIFSSIQDCRKD